MLRAILCGIMLSQMVYAEQDASAVQPMIVESACTLSDAEQAFAKELSEVNQTVFCGMTSEERTSCMRLAGSKDSLGNVISPDQAVARVLGMDSCLHD